MADRIPAAELTAYSAPHPRVKVAYTVTIDNDSIASTDITDRVKKYNQIKFSVYNKHPEEQGDLEFPSVNLSVDNADGYFNLGGSLFPVGAADLKSTTVRVTVEVTRHGSTLALKVLDFTGNLKEPEYTGSDLLTLVAEHPLAELEKREWTDSDSVATAVDRTYVAPLYD